MIQAGVVPCFVRLLGYPNLLDLLNEPVSRSMMRIATWTLSLFCKPPFDQPKLVLPTLARLIHPNDEKMLTHACWAPHIFLMAQMTKSKLLLKQHQSPSVITHSLFTIQHTVSGDDVQTQENPYCCLKYDTNFHLKCVSILDIVKSKYHIHPLILKDSFIEDDSRKYYCNSCEKEIILNDNIYYCEECNGQTIAHIEYMLTEVEDNIKIRKNNHEEPRVVPHSVELVGSPSDDAVCALRNIVVDSLRCLNFALVHGALLPLLAELNEHAEIYMFIIPTWTLSMFCKPPLMRFDPKSLVFWELLLAVEKGNRIQPWWWFESQRWDTKDGRSGGGDNEIVGMEKNYKHIRLSLYSLACLIHSNDNEQVLTDACWALSYLSDGINDKIQVVIEVGHLSPSVITPTLYTVGHIVSGDDVQTQQILLLHSVSLVIRHCQSRRLLVRQSQILHLEMRSKYSNIIAFLVHLLQNVEFNIKKEGAWAISNATSGGTQDQIKYENGFLYYFSREL
ncbi:hypothetical protein CXB51_029098 [Gossypium anomalum]|uniref:Uncharacterized protein n=1 Tax=Gossypium anomalum TaxID=47600 RepID=A0A8J6CQ89_9ROSI|nr:hypothetical protein CXB51_029098 [Gossypium anomalum]